MRASEATVRVQAVVEGLAVDAQDVGLQVALLGRAVGAVPALERLPSCGREGGRDRDTRLHICIFERVYLILIFEIIERKLCILA